MHWKRSYLFSKCSCINKKCRFEEAGVRVLDNFLTVTSFSNLANYCTVAAVFWPAWPTIPWQILLWMILLQFLFSMREKSPAVSLCYLRLDTKTREVFCILLCNGKWFSHGLVTDSCKSVKYVWLMNKFKIVVSDIISVIPVPAGGVGIH